MAFAGMLTKPSKLERLTEKRKAQTSKATTRKDVYRAVTIRDKSKCRACGHWCNPSALEMMNRGHHHHIVYRSRGGKDQTSTICLLCAYCHAAVHDRNLGISGNADTTLRFYGTSQTRDGSWESVA